ncbi:hypothetical protein AA313_de0200506 [Arthrobotrys entomopaga]|nr:hypothetical protein AA313_de0200506 [Arthrobotrys entomopaga]
MATINIRRDVADPFYRYKMEKLQSKIEGKGNGIKSVIVNLPSIATSLARPPIYVVKYFGFELGAQTNTGDHDRWIINGAHEASKLQDLLDGFITKFVLCKECHNPETDLTISKDQNIIRNCKACGQRTMVDARLKLSSYILKNPPKKEGKEKKDKKEKKKSRAAANGEEGKEASNSEEETTKNGNGNLVTASNNLDQYKAEAGSDDEFSRTIQEAAKGITADGTADAQFTIDTSEKAMKERQRNELTSAVEKLTMGDDEEDEEAAGGSSFETFAGWFESQGDNPSDVDDIEIWKKLVELGLDQKHKTLQVLPQCMFNENIVKQISPRAGLLKKLINGSERHEKAFLGGIERLVGKSFPALIPSMPTILHQIYDSEIVSEEAILKWGEKASKRYVDTATSKKVKGASASFLKWLKEADEDEDDSEEEEDDE